MNEEKLKYNAVIAFIVGLILLVITFVSIILYEKTTISLFMIISFLSNIFCIDSFVLFKNYKNDIDNI